jgi:hypothetical protein
MMEKKIKRLTKETFVWTESFRCVLFGSKATTASLAFDETLEGFTERQQTKGPHRHQKHPQLSEGRVLS